jgi:hypothetical protein
MSCPARNDCYVVGTEGLAGGPPGDEGVVEHSAGSAVPSEFESLPIGTPALSFVSCPSEVQCWAAPGKLVASGIAALPRFMVETVDGGSSWQVQPIPGFRSGSAFQLTGLACPTALRCVVAGSTGNRGQPYLAITRNGGRKWVAPALPKNLPPLVGVSCPTADRCLVVGAHIPRAHDQGAVVVATSDAGRSWSVHALPRRLEQADGVSCATENRCAVVGVSTAGGAATALSANGGRSWSLHPMPAVLTVPAGVTCSRSVCVAGGQSTGSGPVSVRSRDGGARWTEITPPSASASPPAYACTARETCDAADDHGLFTSADGGRHWTKTSPASGIPTDRDETPDTVACSAAGTCFVTTEFVGGSNPPSYPLVFSTLDGGTSWRGSLDNSGSAGPKQISCASASQCVILAAASAPELFSSDDGGATWTGRLYPPLALEPGNSLASNGISCPTGSLCVALSGAGILRSTDGGATWEAASLPPSAGSDFLTGIDCPSASTCWAVGGTGTPKTEEPAVILVSHDAGATWEAQGIPSGIGTLDSVSCATAEQCVAVGIWGGGISTTPLTDIVSTDDAGTTWTSRAAPSGVGSLAGVSCPSVSLCVSVGAEDASGFLGLDIPGAAIASADGGVTWRTESIPSGAQDLQAIACSPSGTCTAVGPDTIITTTNGGVGAPLRPRMSRFLAQSVSFVSQNDGFVMGVAPCPAGACLAIRHTVDRGLTWTPVGAPPATIAPSGTDFVPLSVSGLHFADPVNGWAYGTNLWSTHDGGASWREIQFGGPIVALASGAGTAYALVLVCSSCTGGAPAVALYRSPAGEDGWAQVPGVALSQLEPGLVVEGSTVVVLDMSEILSSPNGIDFGSLPIPCVSDGDDPGPFWLATLAASDPSHVAVVCTGVGAAGSVGKELFVSQDGGRTYQRLADPPIGGGVTTLAMPSPSTVLVSASSGASQVYRAAWPDTDWTTPLIFGDGGYGLNGLAFVDPTSGALIHGSAASALSYVGDKQVEASLGTLYLTDDGGATWFPVPVSG